MDKYANELAAAAKDVLDAIEKYDMLLLPLMDDDEAIEQAIANGQRNSSEEAWRIRNHPALSRFTLDANRLVNGKPIVVGDYEIAIVDFDNPDEYTIDRM